jgi:hypothetical protein
LLFLGSWAFIACYRLYALYSPYFVPEPPYL